MDLLQKAAETGARYFDDRPIAPVQEEDLKTHLEEFREKLRDGNEHTLFAQFSQVAIKKAGDSEAEIICPTEMAEVYIKNTRDRLLDFFQQKYGRIIRVLTRVVVDESLPKPTKQLSKQEIYEELVKENPVLQTLRNTLGLQIEY